MCHDRVAIHCIVPPFMLKHMAQSDNPLLREYAINTLEASAALRQQRITAQEMPTLMAMASPTQHKHRLIHSANQTSQLPGVLIRSEGNPPSGDAVVDEAYDHSGTTYDFYEQIFSRRSYDGSGATLRSTVHVGTSYGDPLNNAFWNGRQMAYGDGDGIVFEPFTRSLDVVAHELTHAVQSHESNLDYWGESGALNEHFADVFGALVQQWSRDQPVDQADWLIGSDLLKPKAKRRALRDMREPGTAYDDEELGKDPQPNHYSKKYKGHDDNGGVHINSGIPNRAFVLAATALGGKAWDLPGRIWYDTLRQLSPTSVFSDAARISTQEAARHGSAAEKAVKDAWSAVGL